MTAPKNPSASTGHGTGVTMARTLGKARRYHLWPNWDDDKAQIVAWRMARRRREAEQADRRAKWAADRVRHEGRWYRRLGRAVARLASRLYGK